MWSPDSVSSGNLPCGFNVDSWMATGVADHESVLQPGG